MLESSSETYRIPLLERPPQQRLKKGKEEENEKVSGISDAGSCKGLNRAFPLDSNLTLCLNIQQPKEDSYAVKETSNSDYKATELTTSPQSDGPSQRETSSRLSTLVPEGVRHSLGRLPTFVRLNQVPLYGEKTISQCGSFIYLVNQIFGAGILALPYVVKVSGWLPSFLANILVCLVAMFGTLMIMRCMTMIPGNQNFEKRVEYIPTVEYFLGKQYRFWTELCFYLSIQSLNVVSIAVVAQSLDHLLLRGFGQTVGLILDPQTYTIIRKNFYTQEQVDSIYSGANGLIFGVTVGYFINAIICILLSTQTIDENMKIQYVSFIFLITSVLQISIAAAFRIWHATPRSVLFRHLLPYLPSFIAAPLRNDGKSSSVSPHLSLSSSTRAGNLASPLLNPKHNSYNYHNSLHSSPLKFTPSSVSSFLLSAFFVSSFSNSSLIPSNPVFNISSSANPTSVSPFFNSFLDSSSIIDPTSVSSGAELFKLENTRQHLPFSLILSQNGSSASEEYHLHDHASTTPINSHFAWSSRNTSTSDANLWKASTARVLPDGYSITKRRHLLSEALSGRIAGVPDATRKSAAIAVRPPELLGQYQYGQLLSTFIASYSYVNVVPSWANEMAPGVKVDHAVWQSSGFSCIVYYTFGYLLAYGYPDVHTDNILQEILTDESTGAITKFSIYIFNLLTVLPVQFSFEPPALSYSFSVPGILIYSITTRYNLVNSGKASPRNAFIIGSIAPFAFAWLLANDEYFSAVLQWSSLLFSLLVNFVVPSVVYITACGTQRLATRNPTRHFHTMRSYASRAKEGVHNMMDDVSAQLRDYLYSLPSADLDPHLRILLNQPSSTAASPRHSLDSHFFATPNTQRSPNQPTTQHSRTVWTPDHLEENNSRKYGTSSPKNNQNVVVSIWQSDNETSAVTDKHIMSWIPEANEQIQGLPSQQIAKSSSDVGTPRSLASAPVSLLYPGRQSKRQFSSGSSVSSANLPLRPRRSSVSYLDPKMFDQEVQQSQRPRSLSVKVPLSEFLALQQLLSSSPDRRRPREKSISKIGSSKTLDVCTNSTPWNSVADASTVAMVDDYRGDVDATLIITRNSQCSSEQPINGSSPHQRENVLICRNRHNPPQITASISEPQKTPIHFQSHNGSESTSFPQFQPSFFGPTSFTQEQQESSTLLPSPPLNNSDDSRSLNPLSTSQAHDTPLHSMSTSAAGTSLWNNRGFKVNEEFDDETTARRCNTVPPLETSTSCKPKQVHFGRGDLRLDKKNLTFKQLSSRVVEILNESEKEKVKHHQQSRCHLWKHIFRPLLTSSFSFSKSNEGSFDELKSLRSHHLRNTIAGVNSFHESLLLDSVQTSVGFGTTVLHEQLMNSLQRCQSYSPASREAPQGWKKTVRHGGTLLVPGTSDAPAITITPSTDSNTRLAPTDILSNPLLRLVSTDLTPTASLSSRGGATPASFPFLSGAFNLHSSGLGQMHRGSNNSSLTNYERLQSGGEVSDACTLNLYGSAGTPHSDRRNSWHGLPSTEQTPGETVVPSVGYRHTYHGQQKHQARLNDSSSESLVSAQRTRLRLPTQLVIDLKANAKEAVQLEEKESPSHFDRKSLESGSSEVPSPDVSNPSHEELSPFWTSSHHSYGKHTGLSEQSPGRPSRGPRRTLGTAGRHRSFLAPPPAALNELPVEPPVDLMVAPVEGAEDAYECDEEPATGDLKPIRIHVFPKGPLRTHHLITTRVLMGLLVGFCVVSAGSQIVVDILQSLGQLSTFCKESKGLTTLSSNLLMSMRNFFYWSR